MRLIDADALRLMKVEECEGHTIDYAAGWKACIDWIKTQSTVDAVPVVRCKDCCWCVEDEERDLFCGHKDIYIRPDYFCADGEKVSE